jgi:hypothetical protein
MGRRFGRGFPALDNDEGRDVVYPEALVRVWPFLCFDPVDLEGRVVRAPREDLGEEAVDATAASRQLRGEEEELRAPPPPLAPSTIRNAVGRRPVPELRHRAEQLDHRLVERREPLEAREGWIAHEGLHGRVAAAHDHEAAAVLAEATRLLGKQRDTLNGGGHLADEQLLRALIDSAEVLQATQNALLRTSGVGTMLAVVCVEVCEKVSENCRRIDGSDEQLRRAPRRTTTRPTAAASWLSRRPAASLPLGVP